jgi:hypothetical protein
MLAAFNQFWFSPMILFRAFSAFPISFEIHPGALPQAITFRAVGAQRD